MDTELIGEIRDFIDKLGDVSELNKTDAASIINIIAEKFIKNRNQIWWWETLDQKSATIIYDEGDSLVLLEEIVGNKAKEIMLFVTDDEPEPWPVFQGSFKSIVKIISEQRFFEYFITDNNYSWLIFDTHHNSLIVTGDLLEVAEAKIGLKIR